MSDPILTKGRHYFFAQSRRCDAFRHKRYSAPSLDRWERLVIMGEVVEQRGREVKVAIRECGMQKPDPMDGDLVVLGIGRALMVDGKLRTLEEHGKPEHEWLGRWRTMACEEFAQKINQKTHE